jgi:hypothetical protein
MNAARKLTEILENELNFLTTSTQISKIVLKIMDKFEPRPLQKPSEHLSLGWWTAMGYKLEDRPRYSFYRNGDGDARFEDRKCDVTTEHETHEETLIWLIQQLNDLQRQIVLVKDKNDVTQHRMFDEFLKLNKEMDELKTKVHDLEEEKWIPREEKAK